MRHFILIVFNLYAIQGTAETSIHEELKTQCMKIYTRQEPDAAGIIKGVPVLIGLETLSIPLLLGLMYALNLECPCKLSKTLQIFQRLFAGLDSLRPKPTAKFMTLKNKLLL